MLPNRVKHGMQVSINVSSPLGDWRNNRIEDIAGVWEVLDRAPGGRDNWWIHRHNSQGEWQSVKIDAMAIDEIAPRIEWDRLNACDSKVRAGSYSITNTKNDTGYTNVTGWISGEYGAHNAGKLYGWRITHIPTGGSLPAEVYNLSEAKALLARLGELEPVFAGLEFGQGLNGSYADDVATLKAILKPELVDA